MLMKLLPKWNWERNEGNMGFAWKRRNWEIDEKWEYLFWVKIFDLKDTSILHWINNGGIYGERWIEVEEDWKCRFAEEDGVNEGILVITQFILSWRYN